MSTPTPIKAEATGSAITFDFDGETFEVPPAIDWDLDVLEAFEDGRVLACVRALLGAEQYGRFRAVPRTAGDLGRLMESIQEAMGVPS